MPVSAAILAAHRELHATRREEFLGPALIEYPPISDEERAAALEFSEALKKQLGPSPQTQEQKKLTIVPTRLSLDEQKAELRRRGLLE